MSKTDGSAQAQATPTRYDAVTIALHWTTAALVVLLFGMTLWWSYAPRSIGFRFELEDLHVSLGILLAGVVLSRLVWRATGGRRLPADRGPRQVLAQFVHALLYCGLVAQVALGLALRGLQGGELSLFGWFSLPVSFSKDRPLAGVFEWLHYWNGWALVALAGGHAVIALVHHYWFRDKVLERMLPAVGR